jgi:hypothetical protein
MQTNANACAWGVSAASDQDSTVRTLVAGSPPSSALSGVAVSLKSAARSVNDEFGLIWARPATMLNASGSLAARRQDLVDSLRFGVHPAGAQPGGQQRAPRSRAARPLVVAVPRD